MYKLINKIFLAIIFLFFVSIIFIGCKKDEVVAVILPSIDDKLVADPEFSLFKAAIVQTRLETFTKGGGPFTIFAPTNAALNAVGITSQNLASFDTVGLTATLLNHFQSIKRTSFEIPDGPNAPMTSLAGLSNFAFKNKAADKIYVNGASIITKDILCGNGIIHKIDKVLLPPVLPIRFFISTGSDYTLLEQAIVKTNLTTSFAPSASSPATVFAPNNAAMIAGGYDATTIAGLSAAGIITLSNILKYHIVSSRNFSATLKSGNLKTVFGTNILITSGTSGITVKGNSNPSPFNLTQVDEFANNGVLHKISGLLKP